MDAIIHDAVNALSKMLFYGRKQAIRNNFWELFCVTKYAMRLLDWALVAYFVQSAA